MGEERYEDGDEAMSGEQDCNVEEVEEERVVEKARSSPSVTLSKSWSVKSAHLPVFTGGKITHSALHRSLYTPLFGDVCITDTANLVRLGTVRNVTTDNDGDDEDDRLDADAITAYALAPNESTLLTCSQNSVLRQYLISAETAEAEYPERDLLDPKPTPQQRLQVVLQKTWGKSGHTLPVTDIQFHCSSVFAATSSVDGSVRVWDVRGSFVTHVYRPYLNSNGGGGSGTLTVTATAWFPLAQELVLAIARDDGSICVHNLRDKDNHNAVVVLRDHVSSVTCMEWHVDAGIFVTTGRDAVINLWKFTSTEQTNKNTKKSKPKSSGRTYTRLYTKPIYEQVEGMVLLPYASSLLIATAGTKGQVRLWKLIQAANGEGSYQLELFCEQQDCDSFGEARGGYMNLQRYSNNDNELRLLAADAEHSITFLTVAVAENKAVLTTSRTIVGHNDEILDLKVIPNSDPTNRKIVVATNSAQVRIFDLESFSCNVLDRHTAIVLCVDVSPCGRYIATCGKDKQMRLWQIASTASNNNKCVGLAVGHTEAIGSTALSRKVGRYDVSGKAARNGGGAFCVTVSKDHTLKRWNLPGASDLNDAATAGIELAFETFASTRAHEKDINIVSIAPNDSLIATGSQDKTVKLWKSTDLSQVAILKGHRRGVWDVCFSPFDRIVATCSGDKTIKLWSLGDFSCVRTFQGHVASVLRVRFLSGGLQLVSSGADGIVKLWTVRTNVSEATMDSHNDKVWALDVASNGNELVSGGADSQIVVWEDTTKEVEDAKKAEEEATILVDQKLSNHLRRKEYAEALELSLERDKPHQTLKVLNAIIESDLEKGHSGLTSLKKYAHGWTAEKLVRILRYCREWNTRARNSNTALLTIQAVVTTVPAHQLAMTAGIPEILAGIIPYAERHFERLDRLHASSYILDFALSSMGVFEASKVDNDFAKWESRTRFVLPPKQVDGRVDVGGNVVVKGMRNITGHVTNSDDEIVTVGDSDDSDEDS